MIIVKNQKLLFPSGEDRIGTTYDNQVGERIFRLDRRSSGGNDLSDLNYYLDLQYKNDAYDTTSLRKEVQEEYILLHWNILSPMLQVPGTALVNLRGYNSNGEVKYASFKAPVYIEDVINTPGNYKGGLTEFEQLEQDIIKQQEQLKQDFKDETEKLEKIVDGKISEVDKNQDEWKKNEEQRQQNEIKREQADKKRDEKIDTFLEDYKGELETAKEQADSSAESATLSESWAIGKTGAREGEDTNNSKYYASQSEIQAERAKVEADRAETYSKIIAPGFYVDIESMSLYMKTGVGVDFKVFDDNVLCWAII